MADSPQTNRGCARTVQFVPNHYLSIGFTTSERTDVVALLRRAATEGSSAPMLDGGSFVRWHDDASGARVNVTVDPAGLVRSAKPSFVARLPHRTAVRITGLHPDPADPESDLVQVAPVGATYPLAVEFEDGSRSITTLPFGEEVDLELVGFADALECYPHQDAYLSSGMPMGTRAVLPAGLVPLATSAGPARARATALVSGVVVEVERLHNELGGSDFVHLVVETDGMTLDVVADPASVDGPPLAPGRIVAGSLWFVARVPEATVVGTPIAAPAATATSAGAQESTEPAPAAETDRPPRNRLFGRWS